ncbi:hypothetical protein [Microbacterium endophyticum]|uniref:hypothetical protein n=1 Tax=Microbacterium endophyticum TaxID=1526412 RepID=UPI0013EC9F5D|nr:hypothetical protein [Microbacterium endophyticum]
MTRDADDGAVDSSDDAELRVLRQRAYGPDADIARDLMALQRLRHLESNAKIASTPGASQISSGPNAKDTSEETVGAEPADARPAVSARMRWLWVASIVAAIGSASLVTVVVSTSSPTPYAQLHLIAGADVPEDLRASVDSEDYRRYDDFAGLLISSSTAPYLGQETMCIYAMHADPAVAGRYGTIAACALPGLEPTMDYYIDEAAPGLLREKFTDGMAVRFVLKGDTVAVYVSSPPPA